MTKNMCTLDSHSHALFLLYVVSYHIYTFFFIGTKAPKNVFKPDTATVYKVKSTKARFTSRIDEKSLNSSFTVLTETLWDELE